MFPKNDDEFEEVKIKSVSCGSIERDDGFSFMLPSGTEVAIEPGMTARFYGKGIGSRVRGLFVGGEKVFYRTAVEDKEASEIELYGDDCTEWLARWDNGRSVWSIEMGGMGPGYEQAIQVTFAETLRHLSEANYPACHWDDPDQWEEDREAIEKHSLSSDIVKGLGLSGAQWGAALNLAIMFYRNGPRAVMLDDRVSDRHIQISKNFPQHPRSTENRKNCQ